VDAAKKAAAAAEKKAAEKKAASAVEAVTKTKRKRTPARRRAAGTDSVEVVTVVEEEDEEQEPDSKYFTDENSERAVTIASENDDQSDAQDDSSVKRKRRPKRKIRTKVTDQQQTLGAFMTRSPVEKNRNSKIVTTIVCDDEEEPVMGLNGVELADDGVNLSAEKKEAILAKKIGSRFAYMLVYRRRGSSLGAVAHSEAVRYIASLKAKQDGENNVSTRENEDGQDGGKVDVAGADDIESIPKNHSNQSPFLAFAPADVEKAVCAEGNQLRLLREEYRAQLAQKQSEITERKSVYKQLFSSSELRDTKTAGTQQSSVEDLTDKDDVDIAGAAHAVPFVLHEDSAYFWIETEWLRAWICGQLPATGPGSYQPFKGRGPTQAASSEVFTLGCCDENKSGIIDVDATSTNPVGSLFSAPLDMRKWVCEHGRVSGIDSFSPSSLGHLKRVNAHVWSYFQNTYGQENTKKSNSSIGGDFRCIDCVLGAGDLLDSLIERSQASDCVKAGVNASRCRSLLRDFDGNGEELMWVSISWIKAWTKHDNDLKRLVAKVQKGGAGAKTTGISTFFRGGGPSSTGNE
jgi:hypothetical protein